MFDLLDLEYYTSEQIAQIYDVQNNNNEHIELLQENLTRH